MGKEVLGIHQEALQHRLSCAKRYTDEQKCTVPIRKKIWCRTVKSWQTYYLHTDCPHIPTWSMIESAP